MKRLAAFSILVACGGSPEPQATPPPAPRAQTPAEYTTAFQAQQDAFKAQVEATAPKREEPAPLPPPPVDTRPSVCIEAEKQVAHVNAVIDEMKAALESIKQAEAQIDAAKSDLAREKANPSGVHDLRRMHDDGEAIQASREQKAQAEAIGGVKSAEVKVALAEAKKSVTACNALRDGGSPPQTPPPSAK